MKNALTAKRLSDTLNACGLTAKELADKSGVSKNSISQYINGVHAPSNISAGKMAKVLGVSPVWLMGLDVPAESPRRFPILGAVACGEPILMECDFDPKFYHQKNPRRNTGGFFGRRKRSVNRVYHMFPYGRGCFARLLQIVFLLIFN